MAQIWQNPRDEWRSRLAVGLSLLLHGLIVVLLLAEPWNWRAQPEPPRLLAEFVLPEVPKPPPAPPPAVVPPAPAPQLQQAPIAEESKAPPAAGARARARPPAAEPPRPASPGQGLATAPQRPTPPQPPTRSQAGSRQPAPPGAAGPTGPLMTQSESDFFLSQIVSAWVIDFDAPHFSSIRIDGHYVVLPDGMLAPPFGKNDPFDMNLMVRDWDQTANNRDPGIVAVRTALETFVRAMRLAQPFAMPPGAQGYPKILKLDFRIGDL